MASSFALSTKISQGRGSPLRLLGYVMRALERYARDQNKLPLPAIIPVVLHHSPAGWTAARSLHEMFELDGDVLTALGPYLPSFSFVLEDLARVDIQALRAREEIPLFVRLVLLALKRVRESADLVAEFAAWSDEVDALAQQAPRGLEDLLVVLRYTSLVAQIDPDRLRETFRGRPAEEAVMTTAKQLIEQGRAEGFIEGEARGRAATLLKLLSTHRAGLGPLGAAHVERVHGASIAELELWIERLFTATSHEELFAP